jgi:hypothetical protein
MAIPPRGRVGPTDYGLGMAGELQRDWARRERSEEVVELFRDHAGAAGSVLAWEMQLLRAKEVKGA